MWILSVSGNKTIFTPGPGDAAPGLNRLIHDPDAPADQRVRAELSYFFAPAESLEDLKTKLGL